jgi:hypothetical protein
METREGVVPFGGSNLCQELVLAKALKPSKKFKSQSSGLDVVEEASSANVRISGGKTSSTSIVGGSACRAPVRALDLFDSGSSASGGEAAAP